MQQPAVVMQFTVSFWEAAKFGSGFTLGAFLSPWVAIAVALSWTIWALAWVIS